MSRIEKSSRIDRSVDLENWIYVSETLLPPEQAATEVRSIVQLSRTRNPTLNITGALIFTGSRFSQLIEGPAAGIRALQSSIYADQRHRQVTTISEGYLERRAFDGWSLVYSGDSRYMAGLLNAVELGCIQSQLVHASIMQLFEEFSINTDPIR